MKSSPSAVAVLAAAAFLPSLAFASCGSAFCTVNTNWTTQSALVEGGSSFDLHYEYINQSQPFAGGDKVAVGQVPSDHDEVSTLNRNLMATYSRSFGDGWGLTLSGHVGERAHLHIEHDGSQNIDERWKFTELGDLSLLGRYQFASVGDPLNPSTSGVSAGLKLPTGRTGIANAQGELAERSMQPGTGTTDLILGGYYHQRLTASDASWFAQAQYQRPFNSHAGYKPGSQFGADLGYRHGLGDKLGLLVQLNLICKGRDSGSQAEPAESGGRFLYASPGLSYALSDNLQVYGFVQRPLYRHVNGLQLTANHALLVGLSGRL